MLGWREAGGGRAAMADGARITLQCGSPLAHHWIGRMACSMPYAAASTQRPRPARHTQLFFDADNGAFNYYFLPANITATVTGTHCIWATYSGCRTAFLCVRWAW